MTTLPLTLLSRCKLIKYFDKLIKYFDKSLFTFLQYVDFALLQFISLP